MAPVSRISIVMADDHSLFREGMRKLLELHGDFAVIGEASDGEEAVRLVGEMQPDTLLLDVRMPGLSSLDVVKATRRSSPGTRIVVLTGYADDESHALSLPRAGVHGYLSKVIRLDNLAAVLHTVHRGQRYVEPEPAQRLALHLSRTETRELTPREMEVLRLVAEGLRNTDIAARLSTTPRTVHFHLASLFARLGVKTRTEAVYRARQRGWIS